VLEIILKDGAWFVADSHYAHYNTALYDFLSSLLKQIARQCEVIYLEGNHDFGLEPIFGGSVLVVPRSDQPLLAACGEKVVALHHGDLLQGAGYEIYTALIRNGYIDRILLSDGSNATIGTRGPVTG